MKARALLLSGGLGALAALTTSTPARAGNGETFYMGTDAASFAGASTASTEGASALWYNPARVQVGRADSVDLSGSAYALQLGGNPDLRPAAGQVGTREKLLTLDLSAVPTALAYKRRVLGVEAAAGIFVPNRRVNYPRTLVRAFPEGGGAPTEVALDASERFTEYYAGGGLGAELAPGLSLGGALFGYYSSEVSTLAIAAKNADTGVVRAGTFDELKFGVQLVSGLSWEVSRRVRLGYVLRTPVVQLLGESQESTLLSGYGGGAGTTEIAFTKDALAPRRTALLTPLRSEVGVAIDVARGTTIAVDVKMRGPLSTTDRGRVADPTTDLRAGVRHRAGQNVWVGGGVFTDRSASPRRNEAADSTIDFYGATFALELGSPYRVANRDGELRTLRFSTAIALSYALGLGSVGNLEVAASRGPLRVEERRQDVVAHEFILMLGSTLTSVR